MTMDLSVAVAGGSIGGLCAGNVLSTLGIDVNVYERSEARLSSRGAGIVVQPELVRLIDFVGGSTLATTQCRTRRNLHGNTGHGTERPMPQHFTSWQAIFEALRAPFPNQRYHTGCSVELDSSSSNGVELTLNGEKLRADVLVAADGYQSGIRQALAPATRTQYSGYVAWRGVLDERGLNEDLIDVFDDRFTFCHVASGGHALAYFIPGEGLETDRGHRRLNWVWYLDVEESRQLQALLTDSQGTEHHASIPQGLANAPSIAALHKRTEELDPQFARVVRSTPDPFVQAILDVAPPRMVYDRTCLLGDAAFVVRPHTAGAAAKAAGDALTLGAALREHMPDVDRALQSWEQERFAYGASLLDYGIRLGSGSRRRQP